MISVYLLLDFVGRKSINHDAVCINFGVILKNHVVICKNHAVVYRIFRHLANLISAVRTVCLGRP